MPMVLGGILGGVGGLAAGLVVGWLLPRYGENPPSGSPAWRRAVGLVALGAALLGGYAAWRVGDWGTPLSAAVVTGICLAVSVIDLRVRRIPNVLVGALAVWALVQTLFLPGPALGEALKGALASGGAFALLFVLGRGAMGAGDVKFMAAAGLLLGWPLIAVGMLWGIVLGGLAALFLLATRQAGRKDPMAYGPYLALGIWAVWVWQHVLV